MSIVLCISARKPGNCASNVFVFRQTPAFRLETKAQSLWPSTVFFVCWGGVSEQLTAFGHRVIRLAVTSFTELWYYSLSCMSSDIIRWAVWAVTSFLELWHSLNCDIIHWADTIRWTGCDGALKELPERAETTMNWNCWRTDCVLGCLLVRDLCRNYWLHPGLFVSQEIYATVTECYLGCLLEIYTTITDCVHGCLLVKRCMPPLLIAVLFYLFLVCFRHKRQA